uniref:Uncharacterized protein n=1 Tax=Sina virus TaxID=2703872 RepID=A0A6G9L6R7_9VIRU|nr:MAG: hypothetical protein [Sina virus]
MPSSNKTTKSTPRPIRSGKAVKPVKGLLPLVDDFVSQVNYVKQSTGTFEFKHSAISLREDPSQKSHDVNWLVLGYGEQAKKGVQDEGVATDLYDTEITIENISASTLYIRLQKPMGFRDDPAALAMWEPVVGRGKKQSLLVEVAPHSTRHFRLKNHSTSLVVPRQSYFNGRAAIHLYSMVPYRENISDTGMVYASNASRDVSNITAAIITTTVHFQANDGTVGDEKNFVVESFSGSKRLDQVTTGPAVPIRFCDMHVPGGNVTAAGLYPTRGTTHTAWRLVFFAENGTSPDVPAIRAWTSVDNMDKESVYALPYAVPCVDPGTTNTEFNTPFIAWHEASDDGWIEGWVAVYYEAVEVNSTTNEPGHIHILEANAKSKQHLLPSSMRITPVAGSSPLLVRSQKVSKVKDIREYGAPRALQAIQTKHRTYAQLKLQDANYGETLLDGLTVIVKVVTAALELATVFGFLAVPLQTGKAQQLASSVDDFERV